MAIIFNANENREDEWIDGGQASSILSIAMGAYGVAPKRYDNDELIIQAYLNFGAIIIILILTNCLRRRQMKLIKLIDEKNLTPPDFTVYVMNLPINRTEAEVKEWFQAFDPELDIQKINY